MRISILLIVVAQLAAFAHAEQAGEPTTGPGIAVIGAASVPLKPSAIELSATLSAEAELANDARVKERDARQRVADALEARSPGIKIESRGVIVNPIIDPALLAAQQRQQVLIQNGVVVQMQQNQQEINRRVSVVEQLRLVLKDTDKLETNQLLEKVARLMDAAREAGLQFGQPNLNSYGSYAAQSMPAWPLIVCKASNPAAVRDQAYKAAMEDARQKASALAEVAGVKIGKVIAVRELDAPAEPSPRAASLNTEAGLSSVLIGELSLTVRLSVQFEIVK
ncbi:MAG TPA: SIMPL domain-containing protein [Humisphaera sp.]|jgi:uncharacterized protein YggE|nr:SIMPL domain-containing protein [Humisphaera sp.]